MMAGTAQVGGDQFLNRRFVFDKQNIGWHQCNLQRNAHSLLQVFDDFMTRHGLAILECDAAAHASGYDDTLFEQPATPH